MHCGKFKNGVYEEGRRVSVNRAELLVKLIHIKFLVDGSVL